jgi:type 2 lantibiotic biosynthesis protein LanM
MEFTREKLAEIVERSSTIQERLISPSTSGNRDTRIESPENFLKNWQQILDNQDGSSFIKRLEWDGVNVEYIRNVLSTSLTSPEKPLPEWAKLINDCMKLAADEHQKNNLLDHITSYAFVNAHTTLAFEEALVPFILLARKKLQGTLRNNYDILSPRSHAIFERSLLQILSYISSPPLSTEFSLFRSRQQSILNVLGIAPPNRSDNLYKAFVHNLLTGGYVPFFKEYSFLARLLSVHTMNWINALGELIYRLKSDWEDICTTFGTSKNQCTVEMVHPYCSDLHNSGRSAVKLDFSNGLQLVYKPRDLGMEEAYFTLLQWINTQEIPLKFKILKILNKGTHGWMEYVCPQQCRTHAEVANYYHRAGSTLALLYILQGRDFHCENLIAAGEHPVLVDLETLFHPEIIDNFPSKTEVQNTVLRTQFLPERNFQNSSEGYDAGGLSGFAGQATSFLVPKWSNLKTDGLELEYETYHLPIHHNLPCFENRAVPPEEYLDQIISGFREMYRFFMRHQKHVLGESGPLRVFAQKRSRVLFRSSRIYGHLLRKTLHPKYLRSGLTRSLEFEVLFRKALSHKTPPPWWPLIKGEIDALEQLDIPFFLVRPDKTIHTNSPEGKVVTNCFSQTGFSLAIATIRGLNDMDLNAQLAIIKKALKPSGVFSKNP